MKKKLMRRALAGCLAAALLFAQGAGAFAEEAAGLPLQEAPLVSEEDGPGGAASLPLEEAPPAESEAAPEASLQEAELPQEDGLLPEPDALIQRALGLEGVYRQVDAFATATNYKGEQGMITGNYGGQHTLFNLWIDELIDDHDPGNFLYPYAWEYNGRTFWFDLSAIEMFMERVHSLNQQNISVSVVFLLRYRPGREFLIDEGSRVPGFTYYAPATTGVGGEAIKAFFEFFMWRLSAWDASVDNFILGNEVNDPNDWHYSGTLDPTAVAAQYARAFCNMYNAVRKTTDISRCSISLDHNWTHSDEGREIPGKVMLDCFNAEVAKIQPGVDWCISYHLYPSIMYDTAIWNQVGYNPVSPAAMFVDGANLRVLTDYVRDTFGAQHRVMLTEQGFCLYNGNELYQAAALAISYYAAQYDPMVDCFILNTGGSADPRFNFTIAGHLAETVYEKIDNGNGADQAWIEQLILQAAGRPVQDLVPNYGAPSTKPDMEKIRAFVTRLYSTCLNRAPDAGGLGLWSSKLANYSSSGSDVAYNFIFSKEFKQKNYCNEDYVKQLYRAFMGREYDKAGLDSWMALLESGTTREEVFNGFVGSKEFAGICQGYGIVHGGGVAVPQYGTIPAGPCSVCGREAGVTTFVTRLYDVCLGRAPEAQGLADWCARLADHSANGRDAAYGFIFSREFTAKGYSDEDYVKQLYRAFMGREYDAAGLRTWVTLLRQGKTREEVFGGFVGSAEFTRICAQYGIARG